MPVTITLQEIPIGSMFVSAIGGDEKDGSKNDFRVRISLDGTGTGLTLANVTVSAGSVVEIRGEKNVWEATIRPPTTAQMLTITIAADAFSEGNVETTKTIRLSTDLSRMPMRKCRRNSLQSQAESRDGLTVSPTRILTVDNQTPKACPFFYTRRC